MFSGLKAFLLRGDALALAVGVVIGGAFNKIISAIVEKFFMPIVGGLIGGVDFSTAAFSFGGVEVGWGAVVQALINFFFVGLALYLFLIALGKNPNEAPAPTPTEATLAEIRDILKAQDRR